MFLDTIIFQPFMRLAINAAENFDGATAPNPPVGAVALDSNHQVLGIAAHERAGLEHAERKLIRELKEKNLLHRVDTLLITLEPCAHTGKTPPCAEFIVGNKIKKIIYGCKDPNPKVNGQGIQYLEKAGVQVIGPVLENECQNLIQAFLEVQIKQKPWVTVKTAHRFADLKMAELNFKEFLNHSEFPTSMIPDVGLKTFSRFQSIHCAHLYRRKSQAILTTLPTLEQDEPLFTVRTLADHLRPPQRFIFVCSQKTTPPPSFFRHQDRLQLLGFQVQWTNRPLDLLKSLTQDVQRVLVEAGPIFSQWVLSQTWVNEHLRILHTPTQDLIQKVSPFQHT